AETSLDRIRAAIAFDDVRPRIAAQRVGERVAGEVDCRRAERGGLLEVGAERVADGRTHFVAALARQFGDDVAGAVDIENLFPGAPALGVAARAAVEYVVAAAAVERVVAAEPVD